MIELHRNGPVAELVLARAEARNAINADWVEELGDAVDALAGDGGGHGDGGGGRGAGDGAGGTRAVLIRAEGPAFTVGGDLAHFSAHIDALAPELERMISAFHASLKTLAELELPVVCAAHGSVAGGGLGLLWASDVVLLSEETRLTTAFSRLGLSGDGGSSWYLPRLVGERRALQLMFDAPVISASEAVALGLADATVGAGELLDTARERAARLAAGPTLAYGTMRRLIRGSFARSVSEGLDAETAASVRLGHTEDVQRGIRAFTAGQRPVFEGD